MHAADIHLGNMQYGLEARREDFARAFEEVVTKTIALKPDLMIIAGDLFNDPRPPNPTLATAINKLKRLVDAGIEVLAVEGSHDSAPNITTGTILRPLHDAGLLKYLPSLPGSSWFHEFCYVYGLPNFRTRAKAEENLSEWLGRNPARPDPDLFNIFVFHQALTDLKVETLYAEPEVNHEQIPRGFDYYAGGHIHQFHTGKIGSGILVYSGATETTSYLEAGFEKGVCFVRVSQDKEVNIERIKLETIRRFTVITPKCAGLSSNEITEHAYQLIREKDEPEKILIAVLSGSLPLGSSKASVDTLKLRRAAQKALHVHVVNKLEEKVLGDETLQAMFEKVETRRERAEKYFLSLLSARYPEKDVVKLAKLALNLIEPLTKGEKEKVRQLLEESD